MYPRLERRIDATHAIGRQEQDTSVVIQAAEEDARDGIAAQVCFVALGEEDVGLVEQEDAVPAMCETEVVLKIRLDFHGCLPNVAAGDGE